MAMRTLENFIDGAFRPALDGGTGGLFRESPSTISSSGRRRSGIADAAGAAAGVTKLGDVRTPSVRAPGRYSVMRSSISVWENRRS